MFGRGVVKVVARVEGRVSDKLEDRPMKSVAAGAGEDVGEAGCASADLRRHPAGTGPNLSTASTLKLEKVEPPISGSLMSAPSIANTASTPRWPFTANCCVKLVAPFASVIVPAANSNSWLKSRLLSGSTLTVWLDSASPPVAAL